MRSPSYGDEDPVAAPATVAGESALTLIRCSGDTSIARLGGIFSPAEKVLGAPGNTVIHGWIIKSGTAEKIDEVLVSIYRKPRSYTGEDGFDVSCHGGMAVAAAVMDALRGAGFRDALPGEFTFRAFMNGKLDLTRAESVMELVSAKTDEGRRYAAGRLAGALKKEIDAVKRELVEVLAEAELLLDYSEDEQGEGAGDETAGALPDRFRVEQTLLRLKALAAAWDRERLYREGILAVIAGRPNAGKSSLFNLLMREERSIVTALPGTTRDWIEGWISLEGIPVRLVDTAGLRGDADAAGTAGTVLDEAERMGIARSRGLVEEADLVLYVLDGEAGITGEDRRFLDEFAGGEGRNRPVIVLWNKADLAAPPADPDRLPAAACCLSFFAVSAKDGTGMVELTKAAAALLKFRPGYANGGTGAAGDIPGAAPGTLRQKELIDGAAAALEEALALAGKKEPLDLIAPLIREAAEALGEITGEISTAEILEAMFSRFCVGK
ncbi:MAG: tRNA uridine-5-carboxymethylaminomethyl(34) synthesis GTPase MnmE [Treponema sp.]|jgi:tRNA modification GTPase|nr:tRNA uridine-5-carboxymethylaminomethyl(34) synthesis GTPase MnmE [Treponema sp.]